MKRPKRCGWILLEVLLALVVLAISAASLATTLHETATVLERADATESRIARAERLLNRYVIRSASELERSVGRWTEDEFGVRISRLGPTLYEIRLVGQDNHALLETALYRPIFDEQP